MDDHHRGRFSLPEADHLGYTLDTSDCQRRLTVHPVDILALLRASADDAAHLPSVSVTMPNGGWAYRVRPQDLEALVARITGPAPFPLDAIRQGEAVAILAGRAKPPDGQSNAYARHAGRLDAAVRWGRVTRYRFRTPILGDHPRYSRAEVEALKTRLDQAGVGVQGVGKQRFAQALAPDGLVSTTTTRKLCGVTRQTAGRWGRKGWYGATQIDGAWWFEKEELPAGPARARPEPAVEVPCARCPRPVTKKASTVRKARARGHELYHDECWQPIKLDRLATGRGQAQDPIQRSARLSEAHQRAWDEGRRDRDKQAEVMRAATDAILKSPKARIERIERGRKARGLPPLSEERKRELTLNANSRAATGKAGRKPGAEKPSYHADWTARFEDLLDYHERLHCADPDDEPMPSRWQLCLIVAREDFAEHPERWDYEPATAARAAAARVWKAIAKSLQTAQTEISEVRAA